MDNQIKNARLYSQDTKAIRRMFLDTQSYSYNVDVDLDTKTIKKISVTVGNGTVETDVNHEGLVGIDLVATCEKLFSDWLADMKAYARFFGNTVAVYDGYGVKDDLKKRGYKFDGASKSWRKIVDDVQAEYNVIKYMGITRTMPVLSDAQRRHALEMLETEGYGYNW